MDLSSLRKTFLALIYFSFMLFPIMFVNKVYISCEMEKRSELNTINMGINCINNPLTYSSTNAPIQIENTPYTDNFIEKTIKKLSDSYHYDIYFKTFCAVILSAILSNKNIRNIGVI